MEAINILDQLNEAITDYADVLKSDVEDIAIVNAERAVFDLITAYADARAAQERERAIQAVTAQANALPADVDDAFYAGYKLAIRNALAALRADQPGA